jgi:hypothetical protein
MSSSSTQPSCRTQVPDLNSDPDQRAPARSHTPFLLPRRAYTSPDSPSYTRIIRLEGQILALISILRFHLRYAPYFLVNTSLDALRLAPLPMYFNVIEELVGHINEGCDLNSARNAGELVRLARKRYFDRVRRQCGEEEVEKEGHWSKILWFAGLQRILEDENLDLGEAVRRGWEWFMDAEGFPASYGGLGEWVVGWHELDKEKQGQFLQIFKVDADALRVMAKEVEGMLLKGPTVLEHEIRGCLVSFSEQKKELDVTMPLMVNPSKQRLGDCPICDVSILKEDIGTNKEHRPVEIPCGHIFGSSCIKEHFVPPRDWLCPVCKRNLIAAPRHPVTPSELVESCDRILKWLDPPTHIDYLEGPNSYLEKLTLIFEPADAIRKHFDNWLIMPQESYAKLLRLQDLALYLARDRLDAAGKGDTAQFRKAVAQQMQVVARLEWSEFLVRCHPGSPMVW